MNIGTSEPLVSVGMPTFNRPEGLRRSLRCITNQTHRNLEIVVSNNSSHNEETKAVMNEFLQNDSRIKYFPQQTNIGAWNNFTFVLKEATGEFFMWASDDDEWKPEFIQVCLANIGTAGSIMTGFTILNRFHNVSSPSHFLPLSQNQSPYFNAQSFLKDVQPSLIYGLHRTATILNHLSEQPFDYYDCYFVLRQILVNGFNTIPDDLYVAGIDSATFVKKPWRPNPGRFFEYDQFYLKAGLAIASCEAGLSKNQCKRLLRRLMLSSLRLFYSNERNATNSLSHKFQFVRFSFRILMYRWVISKNLGLFL